MVYLLQKLFAQYGPVADLRIHSKNTNLKGGPAGNKVPNYGFITFEDSSSVKIVLEKRVRSHLEIYLLPVSTVNFYYYYSIF